MNIIYRKKPKELGFVINIYHVDVNNCSMRDEVCVALLGPPGKKGTNIFIYATVIIIRLLFDCLVM